MEKVITIANKNYKMKASALTQFSYKNFTGRSFLDDVQNLVKLQDKKDDFKIKDLDEVTELLLKVAFIMAKEAKEEKATDYDTFLSTIDNLYDNEQWIYEVLELACTPISGRLQINK